MMKHTRGMRSLLATALVIMLISPTMAQAQSAIGQEKILAHATNNPLKSLQEEADRAMGQPVVPQSPRQVPNFVGQGNKPASGDTSAPDALLQSEPAVQATAVGSGFYGADNNDNGSILGFLIAPPDTDGQVGPSHYVQMINLLTTVFNKDGTPALGPVASNVFWAGMGGNCAANNQGDPVVLYDDQADRWLVSQFAFPDSLTSYSQCVAISQTPDPTGAWHRYEFSFSGIGFNDYPKHGIVSNSITLMANLFTKTGPNFNWAGTFLGVMDKARMYNGQSASLIGYNIGTAEFGFVAGDLDGPGTSVPALFGTAMSTSNRFDIWKIDVNWSTQAASRSRIASIPITAFSSSLCGASRGACIPQPSPGPKLESLSDRLMHRLQIRDFGSYRTMVTAHTVNVGSGRAGIRWYELRETGGTWSLYQEGTFAPNDGLHRWMPSAAMNSLGDIGIGYLLANASTFVSTAAAGQTAAATGSDVLDSSELICAAGTGVQTGVSRSGDYSSTSVDPIDDTFWHTNEVFTQTGNFQWNTYVCEFAVGAGGGGGNTPPTAGFSYACSGLNCTFTDSSNDSDGTIFSRAWAFGDGGTSTDTNPSHAYAAGGTYNVTLTVTDNGGATDPETKSVTVSGSTLVPSSSNAGKTWTARVTDTRGSGFTLTGDWSPSGTSSCLANVCTRTGISKKTASVVFTSTSGTTSGTKVTVLKP